MQMLSEDDRNLKTMNAEELALAWDLWFDLAQTTNASDPPYAHGVFAGAGSSRADVMAGHARQASALFHRIMRRLRRLDGSCVMSD